MMSTHKSDTKVEKRVIRYPEVQRPENVIVRQSHGTQTETITPTQDEITEVEEPKIPDISVPILNSTLCVKNRMEQVEKKLPKKVKSIDGLTQTERITFDEKITKHVNFPLYKKLYKELISLNLVEKPDYQPSTVIHDTTVKDKYPKLEDFYTPPTNTEYSIPVTTNLASHNTTKSYHGTRLQDVMNTWKDNRRY